MTEPIDHRVAQQLKLPRNLDLAAAGPLAGSLLALRGSDVSLDASDVEKLGALCLQVLISARATWLADRVALTICQASAAFSEQARLLGAPAFADVQVSFS